jgi:hypothetical protein
VGSCGLATPVLNGLSFTILFHPDAAHEISIPPAIKERLKKAIAGRLMTEQALYGKPLRDKETCGGRQK